MQDAPASDLVLQIHAATRSSTLKQRTGSAPSRTDAVIGALPFSTPAHWEWLPLIDVGTLSGGMTPSKSRSDFWGGEINWLSPKDIKTDDVGESELRITAAGVTATGLQIYPPGCLFIVARSGILKRTLPVAINRLAATANQDMKVLRPFVDGLERYLQIMFKGMTDFILGELVKTGTTVQSLKYEEFERQPVPLPPLAEQYRIVAKVDELMVLCDQLEAAQVERESRRDALRAASLHRLTVVDGDRADRSSDVRFFLQQSPRMVTKGEHVVAVRRAILDLAVRGRLVAQDPCDEPASELLRRVQSQKSVAKPGTTGKDWMVGVTTGVQAAFPPPPGWAWSRIGAAVERVTVGYVGPMTAHYVGNGVPFLRSQNVRANQFRPEGLIAISPEFHARIGKSAVKPGDVVVVRSGNVGVACVVPDYLADANCSDLVIIKNPAALVPSFLSIYLNSLAAVHVAAGAVGIALTHFNTRSVATMPVPIPPLAEQHRIVSKVEELMAVCDEFERALASAQTERARLLDALLHGALDESRAPVSEHAAVTAGRAR
jgi:type I restriction enzyme S subunit